MNTLAHWIGLAACGLLRRLAPRHPGMPVPVFCALWTTAPAG